MKIKSYHISKEIQIDQHSSIIGYSCMAFYALKGVVASYQAALSEEYTPLERVQPVLTWSRGCPGHNKMVSEGQIQ